MEVGLYCGWFVMCYLGGERCYVVFGFEVCVVGLLMLIVGIGLIDLMF